MYFREAGFLGVLTCLLVLLCIPVSSAASMEIIQKGVSGSVTSELGLGSLAPGQNHVFFGTQLGVYVFSSSGGELVSFIQTSSPVTNVKSVPDINGNGFRELVVTTSDVYFPNVLCFDSSSGERLWEFSSETEVFDMDMMWTMKQVPAHSLEVSESGEMVYLTAGYHVYCLDSRSGTELWSFEGEDNMWELVLYGGDVVAGDQTGRIHRLDGESGSPVWSVLASQPYTVVNPSTNQVMGEVKRSVWDIVPLEVDGKTRVAASCEDGYLHILDFETGEILLSTEVIDYVDELLYSYYGDYPITTSSFDYNFFNIRALELPDVNGDGNPEVLAYTYPGTRMGREYQGAQAGLYVVDSSAGDVISKNENVDLGTVSTLGTLHVRVPYGMTFLLLPAGRSGSAEKVRVISPEDCGTLKTISINATPGFARNNRYATADLGESDFIIISDYGDLTRSGFSGRVEWSYPRLNSIELERAELVGSAGEDLLVRSVEGLSGDDLLEEGTSRSIFVIDGETREVSWSYEMPHDEFVLTGGLRDVTVIPDVNGDGRMDIAAYKQRPAEWGTGDEFGNHTRIMVLSGSGGILWENPITNKTHYGMYERIYRYPPCLENMLAEQWGYHEEATVLSIPQEQRSEFKRQLAELESRVMEQERERRIRKTITSLGSIGDVSGDGVPDLIVGSWRDVFIIDSVTGKPAWNRTYQAWAYEDPFGNNPMAGLEWNWSNDDRLRYSSLGDINGDGHDELLQVSWNGMWILHSNLTGGSLDYAPHEEIKPDGHVDRDRVSVIRDMSGDGLPDIMFRLDVEDSSPVYRIVKGTDGYEITEFEREGTSVSLAAADLNSDGLNESLAFYKHGSSGPRFEVIGGRSRDAIWSYPEYEEAWMLEDMFGITSIIPACAVGDMNGDGSDDLVLGRSLPWDRGAELLVYDIGDNELIKSVTVESQDPTRGLEEKRWQPAVVTERLSDLTGDGISEVATVMALGEGDRKQLKLLVVDLAREEIISDFTARGTVIEDVGGEIAVYGRGGEIYLLRPGRDISITSPREGERVSSPVGVAWEAGEETVKILMVDGRMVTKTSGGEAEFDVREGSRKISVYSFDRHGKGVYDSVDVVVEKGSAAAGSLTVLVILLLAVLALPRLLPLMLRGGISSLIPSGEKGNGQGKPMKEEVSK
jgi:outer membrane protein assembly factor BamB